MKPPRLPILGPPTVLLFLAASLACAPPGAFTPPPDPVVGTKAPPFVFHGVQRSRDGQRRAYPSENFDGKTLALIFIRPGQPDLQLFLSELERIRHDPALQAVQIMVLSPEDDPLTEPFWIGLRSPLPLGLDFTNVAARYGAGTLPMVVIRDYKGIIRLRLDGFVGNELLPRLEATRKILRQVEAARTRPSGSVP